MIRILLVDDHAIVRAGYRALLAKQPDLQVIAEATDTSQAYQLFKQTQPDLVVTDISLPGSSGIELIYRIKQWCHDAKILVFSMHRNTTIAEQSLRAGALGYVTKSSEPEMVLRAIREVYAVRHILSPDIAQQLALEKMGSERQAVQSLTTREFEILQLLMNGLSHGDIASMLNISAKTVSNCHYLIKNKLGVSNDIALTKLAIKLNVVDLLSLTQNHEIAS